MDIYTSRTVYILGKSSISHWPWPIRGAYRPPQANPCSRLTHQGCQGTCITSISLSPRCAILHKMRMLHDKDRTRPKGRMQNEALVCSTRARSDKYAARWASERYRMADWGYRSPSVHKPISGVANPTQKAGMTTETWADTPWTNPWGVLHPSRVTTPFLSYSFELVDWWVGMSV